MLINWADAEVAPAGHRDPRVAEAAKLRANEVIGRAGCGARVSIGAVAFADVRTVDLQRVAAKAANFRAHVIENFKEQTDVGNVRHVLDPAHAVYQQRGRENGHGGVLRARDRDSAFQPLPALYDVFYQIKSPLRFYWKHRMQSGGFAVSAGSTGMICGFAPKSVFAEARRSAVAMQTSAASSGHLLRIPHRRVKVKKK